MPVKQPHRSRIVLRLVPYILSLALLAAVSLLSNRVIYAPFALMTLPALKLLMFLTQDRLAFASLLGLLEAHELLLFDANATGMVFFNLSLPLGTLVLFRGKRFPAADSASGRYWPLLAVATYFFSLSCTMFRLIIGFFTLQLGIQESQGMGLIVTSYLLQRLVVVGFGLIAYIFIIKLLRKLLHGTF